ncbi:DNA polymerase IV [Erysipelothrix sp. HDW6C]|nr:DNA polymerase IV [Erysipelothrix sp. HDW6C]
MPNRIIFHIDINHCFAQIEEMMNPELRKGPMCVGGDEKKRSGIVLARNLKAREFGIVTAETLRDAFQKCPALRVVPPQYDKYVYYTSLVKDIYREYTDKVESYGLDEAWLDITESAHLFGKPFDIAYEIQNRVLEEYGLTVSVGVSWNKVFAKLGSDLIKPSGMTIITPYNFKEIVWPQPVDSLLFIGQQTKPKLNAMGIFSIGDLAQTPIEKLEHQFGLKGSEMWRYANGLDASEVDAFGHVDPPKSISNSTTPPHDINTLREAEIILQRLCESVASRMRDEKVRGYVVTVSPRDVNLKSFSRRRKLDHPINLTRDILNVAMTLLSESYDFDALPLRSIGVNVSRLIDEDKVVEQMGLFERSQIEDQKEHTIDTTIDMLRDKFGFHTIKRGSALLNKDIENFDAKRAHSVFPGRKRIDNDEENLDNKKSPR